MISDFFITNWPTIQLIILSLIGSFVGEFYRSTISTSHESFDKFAASFLIVALMSFIVALIVKYIFNDDWTMTTIATLASGVLGKETAEKILQKFMGNIMNSDDKKK